MGLNKGIGHILLQLFQQAGQQNRKKLRTLLLACVALALFFVAGTGLLIYGAVQYMGGIFDPGLERDLVALKGLVSEKVIVLRQEQKKQMEAVLTELATPELPAERREQLRQQLLAMLDASQMQDFSRWRDTAMEQARALTAIPLVANFIEESTGISIAYMMANAKAFLSWFGLVTPDNSADLLREVLEDPERRQIEPGAAKP